MAIKINTLFHNFIGPNLMLIILYQHSFLGFDSWNIMLWFF